MPLPIVPAPITPITSATIFSPKVFLFVQLLAGIAKHKPERIDADGRTDWHVHRFKHGRDQARHACTRLMFQQRIAGNECRQREETGEEKYEEQKASTDGQQESRRRAAVSRRGLRDGREEEKEEQEYGKCQQRVQPAIREMTDAQRLIMFLWRHRCLF